MFEHKDNDIFYCRYGMQRFGPFNRKKLRQLLKAGLIDAHSLVRHANTRHMQPLGASPAAGEITWVAREWNHQYSIWFYAAWLIFMPLFSAGIAGMAIAHCNQVFILLPLAMLLGNLGMSIWLYQTWRILLAEDRMRSWKAALYAFPMTLPLVNYFWIWIGYLRLPGYWRKFKSRHNIPDNSPYWLYYLVMILFYLVGGASIFIFSGDIKNCWTAVWLIGLGNWFWFGLVLLSLFLTDRFTLLMIKNKLSILAFGAVRFCADINYDILHRAVLMLALRAKKGVFYALGVLLLISWLTGGWFWMNAIKVCYLQYNKYDSKLEYCPLCEVSNFLRD